jgi:predicted ester cyclase
MSDTDRDIVNRIPLEAFNQGRLDVVDEVVSADMTDHSVQPGMPPGREGIKSLIRTVRAAFPDLKNTIIKQIAEGDTIVQYVRSSGTMKGDFMGMKATGRSATWEAIHIVRLADGKIVEHWSVQDNLGMLRQLGLTPAAPGAQAA